jgi:hypothetical protein
MSKNFGQIALEKKFDEESLKAVRAAREMGHDTFWVKDDTTEGAIGCNECGLWGRVIVQPLADRTKSPDEIAGAILTTRCSVYAASMVHGAEALRIRQFSDKISLPAMFAGEGYEPKEVRKNELIAQGTRFKKGTKWSFNGRVKGGKS